MTTRNRVQLAIARWHHDNPNVHLAIPYTLLEAVDAAFKEEIEAVEAKIKVDRDDLEQRFTNMARASSAGHVEAVHKHLCTETQLAETQRQLAALEDRLRLALAEEKAAKKQAGEYGEALAKINVIRDSIIGTQQINWSEHIYPLVAALNGAGFGGILYATTRVNMGTLIERHDAMEKLATTAQLALAEAEKEIARLNSIIDNGSESNTNLIIERDQLKAALADKTERVLEQNKELHDLTKQLHTVSHQRDVARGAEVQLTTDRDRLEGALGYVTATLKELSPFVHWPGRNAPHSVYKDAIDSMRTILANPAYTSFGEAWASALAFVTASEANDPSDWQHRFYVTMRDAFAKVVALRDTTPAALVALAAPSNFTERKVRLLHDVIIAGVRHHAGEIVLASRQHGPFGIVFDHGAVFPLDPKDWEEI